MSFGPDERISSLNRLSSDEFDMVVIGAGINGAGIFRDAALRGLKIAVVDKGDFASGTSSRSSKLVHGGLRYLEHFKFGLVYESTHERAQLMKLARHAVRPLAFLLPVWKSSKHGLWYLHMGLFLYDLLASFKNYKNHVRLNPLKSLELEPLLKKDSLTGSLHYYDAITDDSRLTIENIMDGHQLGGVAVSRCEANNIVIENDRVKAVQVTDLVTGDTLNVKTNVVIIAAGPWTEKLYNRLGLKNTPKLRPTKGVHVILPLSVLPLKQAVAIQHPIDNRGVFMIPWHGASVIGTTDTDFSGSYSEVYADNDDVEYLLEIARSTFPEFKGTASDVLGTWAGLRPLVAGEDGQAESDLSREHVVTTDHRGIVSIVGGKLTTYRLMSIEAVEAAIRVSGKKRVPRSTTNKRPLPYCDGLCSDSALEAAIERLMTNRSLSRPVATRLLTTYGTATSSVLTLAGTDPSLLKPLHPQWPVLRVEVVNAVLNEGAMTLQDVLCRRTPIFFLVKGEEAVAIYEDAAQIMAKLLNWAPKRQASEVAQMKDLALRHTLCLRSPAPEQ